MLRAVLDNGFYLLRALIGRRRFLRLGVLPAGAIVIYDRTRRRFFRVRSRDLIDSETINQVYTKHDYDLRALKRGDELYRRYETLLAEGTKPLIIDCGANIGLSARYLAEEFPGATVVAVEPEAGNCALLAQNCAPCDNVVLRPCAIGSSPGRVAIANPEAGANAFRTERGDAGEGIEVITVPELLAAYPDHVPFLIKVDIEGFERDLFASNTAWVRAFPIMIMEMHDWMLPGEANGLNFLKVISAENRDFVYRGENVFSLANG